MHDTRPIGVFDSGVGGLSVLKELRRSLPHEDFIYCADSGFAPYGSRSSEQIVERSRVLSTYLLARNCKALVIACNTATAAAAAFLRTSWPQLPIVGMEPAVKPATAATRKGVVGVLATVGTLASAKFAALLDTFGRDVRVVTQPGIGLVECVERGDLDSQATRDLLTSHLQPLLAENADVIVLGCTHYVFLRSLAERIAGSSVTFVDTGAAVAAQLVRQLDERGLRTCRPESGSEQFWTTSDGDDQRRAFSLLWREDACPNFLPR